MPRKKSGLFDNKAYQNEYHKAMKTKLISFNPANTDDMKIWEFLMSKGRGNVSPYIKELIKLDMEIPSLSCHIVFKRIKACHDCNDCGNYGCGYDPDPGQTTRINCPLWKEKK